MDCYRTQEVQESCSIDSVKFFEWLKNYDGCDGEDINFYIDEYISQSLEDDWNIDQADTIEAENECSDEELKEFELIMDTKKYNL